MTENETETTEDEPTTTISLEDADELMYDSLVDEFGEGFIAADLREVVKERVRQLYDNREQVAQQVAQAQQQSALGGQ
jgi:hypothetical protein